MYYAFVLTTVYILQSSEEPEDAKEDVLSKPDAGASEQKATDFSEDEHEDDEEDNEEEIELPESKIPEPLPPPPETKDEKEATGRYLKKTSTQCSI